MASRWHDVFSARVKLSCPESVLKGCVLPPSNTVQTPPKNETRDAGWKAESLVRVQGCVKAFRGGYLRVSAATVRFPWVSKVS